MRPPRRRFAEAAEAWTAAGWSGVLPLPVSRKESPPAGFTGACGLEPDPSQIRAWVTENAYRNAALRLPCGVIGLDVDTYGDKRGDRTLARHVQAHGPLQPTWTIVNRQDGRSGTRLYRCAFEGPFRSSLDGGDVDLIHRGYRY